MNLPTAEIIIFDSPEKVASNFAHELFILANQSKKPIHIVLSGGSTPIILFDTLAKEYSKKIPWEHIHFWWGDERCVPPSHDESNYKMTNNHLFSKIQINPNQIHRIKGELDPEQAADEYISEIEKHVSKQDGLPVFDLIILGMGTDGHTASIFPDSLDLLNSHQICEVATHPDTGQKRVTLTGKVINNARKVVFLVTGSSKKERIAEIFNQKEEAKKLPSFYIHPNKGELFFYLDREAASEIKKSR